MNKKTLEGNYGKILAMCKNNFDLAQDVCVYFLESHEVINDETVSKTIDNITRLKTMADTYPEDDQKHHIILNAAEKYKDHPEALDKYKECRTRITRLHDKADFADPVLAELCSDEDVMDIMTIIRRAMFE